jgi:hypothetical protein
MMDKANPQHANSRTKHVYIYIHTHIQDDILYEVDGVRKKDWLHQILLFMLQVYELEMEYVYVCVYV